MHVFMVCPTQAAADVVPTSEEVQQGANPSLRQGTRQHAWVVPNAIMVAIGRSHGAYARKDGMPESRISFVFSDTVCGTLPHTCA
jgi:hypothetical protein